MQFLPAINIWLKEVVQSTFIRVWGSARERVERSLHLFLFFVTHRQEFINEYVSSDQTVCLQ